MATGGGYDPEGRGVSFPEAKFFLNALSSVYKATLLHFTLSKAHYQRANYIYKYI